MRRRPGLQEDIPMLDDIFTRVGLACFTAVMLLGSAMALVG